MNKWDDMLDLYIGELIPPSDILDKIKIDIDMQINKADIENEGVFNTPAYLKTAEIFKKAFSVLENYNIKCGKNEGFTVYK